MATGIVSVAAVQHGQLLLSVLLGTLAAAGLPVLTLLAAHAWRSHPPDLTDLDVVLRLFTFVAACTVLAVRFDASWLMPVLAVLGAVAWIVLFPLVPIRMWRAGWSGLRGRARGAWELVSVATSGLAIVCAEMRLVPVAVAFWVLALVLYLVMTTCILSRITRERLDRLGLDPDSWILMGALAITTVAGVRIYLAWPQPAVAAVTVVTWLVATAWIPVLLLFTVRRMRRQLAAPSAWWASVFPLAMYSSATLALSVEVGWGWLRPVSATFFWIALGAWVLVAGAAGERLYRDLTA